MPKCLTEEQVEKYNRDGFASPMRAISAADAAAAAMWLAYRDDDIAAQYTQPWKRIEAFRNLLRATAAPVDGGYQSDLDDDNVDEVELTTGILDIEAVLSAELPAARDLAEETDVAAEDIA